MNTVTVTVTEQRYLRYMTSVLLRMMAVVEALLAERRRLMGQL